MKRIIRLTESDLTKIVKRVIKEQDEKLEFFKRMINAVKKAIEQNKKGLINVSVTNQNAKVSLKCLDPTINLLKDVLVSDFPFIFDVKTNPSYTPEQKILADKLREHFLKLMKKGKTININITHDNAEFTYPGIGLKSNKTYTENLSPTFLAYVFSVE